MSRFDRIVGIARSIAVYHALPWRPRRMRRLYSQWLERGDLVFDIGAHAGNRARAFRELGCIVVAVEPQPDFARLLRTLFARVPDVTIVEAAVGAESGRRTLAVSDRTPTVTTMAEGWRARRAADPDFSRVRWNRRVDVDVTTLDALVARFGAPAFVKIDVEGGEPAVLAGLTTEVPMLSFEYLPRALDEVRTSIARLRTLGEYRFNWSPGETYRLASAEWVTGDHLMTELGSPEGQRRSGDVYAVLATRVYSRR